MIRYAEGNLLDAQVDALVNAVNTVGVMGKGIALQFKARYPDAFVAYAAACKKGEVQTGRMFVHRVAELGCPQWIVHFPTKQHWRDPSQLAWIDSGLQDLVRVIHERSIRSIALPALGCGNGGLDWPTVRNRIEAAFTHLDIDAVVYEPASRG